MKFFKNVKNWAKGWVSPEEYEPNEPTGVISIHTQGLSLTADFDDEQSMKLAQTIIDDVIFSRWGA